MALCRRISDLYALALLTVYALFLPLGGYERMMEASTAPSCCSRWATSSR